MPQGIAEQRCDSEEQAYKIKVLPGLATAHNVRAFHVLGRMLLAVKLGHPRNKNLRFASTPRSINDHQTQYLPRAECLFELLALAVSAYQVFQCPASQLNVWLNMRRGSGRKGAGCCHVLTIT